jgi:hypothetical protein
MTWQKGQPSPNPRGRYTCAKARLSQVFLDDLVDDWKKHGIAALKSARENDPALYCMMIARLVPRDINLNTNASQALLDALKSISAPAEEIPEGPAGLRAGGVAGHA